MVSNKKSILEASLFLVILTSFAPHEVLSIGGAGAGGRVGVGNQKDRDEWMSGQAPNFADIDGGNRDEGNIMGGRGLPGRFFGNTIELSEITCDAQLSCRLPRRGGRGPDRGENGPGGRGPDRGENGPGGRGPERGENGPERGDRFDNPMGTFVCRSSFDPVTGEPEEPRAVCIPNDQAWSTDVCGCCEEDCPTLPEFTTLVCDPETQPTPPEAGVEAVSRRPGGNETVQVVCRDQYDPFTGILNPITIPIKSDMALEGDDCGCCDGVCPTPGQRPPFERPETVLKSCDAEEFVACELPRRGGESAVEETTGFYVCRTMFDRLSGEEKSQAKCILEDQAWESDQCGCCGEDCPDRSRPSFVELECAEPEEACSLRNGMPGVFACRSIFNPFDGALQPTSLCIPSDKAWETDTCGCCLDTGCPVSPREGFPDEETQLMALAAGEPVASFVANEDSGSTGSNLVFGAIGVLIALTGTGLAGML